MTPPVIVLCGICKPQVEMLAKPSGMYVCPNCGRVKLYADQPAPKQP